jgi:hypothetical protein
MTQSSHPFHWRRIKPFKRTEDSLHEHTRGLGGLWGSEQGTTREFWSEPDSGFHGCSVETLERERLKSTEKQQLQINNKEKS